MFYTKTQVMKANMGNTDRAIRLIVAVAAVLIGIFVVKNTTIQYVLFGVAGIFTLTSLVKFCPLYTLFGWNTCKK